MRVGDQIQSFGYQPQMGFKVPNPFAGHGGEVIGGLIGLGGTLITNALQAKEAKKQRDWEERMSNTAHSREVADLKNAGINPYMSGGGSGASTPSGAQAQIRDVGEGISRGVASALAVKQMKASIGLTDAEASKARSEAAFLGDSYQNRLREQGARTDLAELNATQLRRLLDVQFEKAKKELQMLGNSAQIQRANLDLLKAYKAGAVNDAEFQKRIGSLGPAALYLMEIVKALRGTQFIPTGK